MVFDFIFYCVTVHTLYSEDPVITNYLVNNKSIRYSGVTKLNNGINTTQNSLQARA